MLTAKQESFCLAYLETGNASEAYRSAYKVKPGTKPESVHRAAKGVLDNAKIASRLDELRAPVRKKAMLTLENHLERLNYLSTMAEQAGQFGPAIKAEESRGKAAGLYVERIEHGGSIATTIDASALSSETMRDLLNARRSSSDE